MVRNTFLFEHMFEHCSFVALYKALSPFFNSDSDFEFLNLTILTKKKKTEVSIYDFLEKQSTYKVFDL